INLTSPSSYSRLGCRSRGGSSRYLSILCIWSTSFNFLCSIGLWRYLSCTSGTRDTGRIFSVLRLCMER
ncbi:unnamed protein product, partial [Linum tenue]